MNNIGNKSWCMIGGHEPTGKKPLEDDRVNLLAVGQDIEKPWAVKSSDARPALHSETPTFEDMPANARERLRREYSRLRKNKEADDPSYVPGQMRIPRVGKMVDGEFVPKIFPPLFKDMEAIMPKVKKRLSFFPDLTHIPMGDKELKVSFFPDLTHIPMGDKELKEFHRKINR
jgi:hypothetical protein